MSAHEAAAFAQLCDQFVHAEIPADINEAGSLRLRFPTDLAAHAA
jgi:hypothetical protein